LALGRARASEAACGAGTPSGTARLHGADLARFEVAVRVWVRGRVRGRV